MAGKFTLGPASTADDETTPTIELNAYDYDEKGSC